MAVAFGMLLGTSILSIYVGSQADVMAPTWESVTAAYFADVDAARHDSYDIPICAGNE